MIIRKAAINDKEQIGILFSDENDHHYRLQPDVFNKLLAEDILPENWFEDILNDDSQTFFVAEDGKKLAGLILVSVCSQEDTLFKEKKWLLINELSVLTSYRGRGIGKLLMSAVEEYAREIKAESIKLEVWENNSSAIGFYKHYGFDTKKLQMWKKCVP